eukprot:15449861-Alexandrium_andersonii.AAC.1
MDNFASDVFLHLPVQRAAPERGSPLTACRRPLKRCLAFVAAWVALVWRARRARGEHHTIAIRSESLARVQAHRL